jgi:hypothetical protein
MFIREVKKRIKKDGKSYDYIQHRLVESVRTPKGPRQRTVLNLGTLEISKDKFKALANSIEALLNKQNLLLDTDAEITGLAIHFADVIIAERLQQHEENADTIESTESSEEEEPRYETIDVNSTTASIAKSVGGEHIALSFFQQIGFFETLEACGFSKKHQQYAAAQICGRLVYPESERETARWLREDSAMDELLGVDFSKISDHTLHRVADKLFANKEFIEQKISEKTKDLFSLDDSFVFYDLTNTYFESPKRDSNIAKYSKSKEKRNDCPVVTLALVVDAMGFPKKSRIYEGNVAEGDTLFDILEELSPEGTATTPKTVIVDAGLATEDNLDRLRADKRFEYVAVSRKKIDRALFKDLPATEHEVNRQKVLTIKTLRQEDETFLLCSSEERAAKEEAIFTSRKTKFEKELTKLNKGLSKPRTRKKYDHILERIGRLKERHKMGQYFEVKVTKEKEIATEIKWTFLKNKPKEPGEYIIRTSRTDLADKQISILHRTLTMIESSFRWMKMDLGLRPNFHQRDDRMGAHIFITVLAYYVLAPILHKIDWGGKFCSTTTEKQPKEHWERPYGWKGVIRTMKTQARVTTSFVCEDNCRMDIRTSSEATAKQLEVYKRLNVSPRPLKRIIVKHNN